MLSDFHALVIFLEHSSRLYHGAGYNGVAENAEIHPSIHHPHSHLMSVTVFVALSDVGVYVCYRWVEAVLHPGPTARSNTETQATPNTFTARSF